MSHNKTTKYLNLGLDLYTTLTTALPFESSTTNNHVSEFVLCLVNVMNISIKKNIIDLCLYRLPISKVLHIL